MFHIIYKYDFQNVCGWEPILKCEQECIQSKANHPLRDRNPNTYNLLLE